MSFGNNDEADPPDLPREVLDALTRRYAADELPAMPERLDAAILADAHAHLSSLKPLPLSPTKWQRQASSRRWITAVASITAAAFLVVLWRAGSNNSQHATVDVASSTSGAKSSAAGSDAGSISAADIDGDGQVDILDAYTLALNLRSGGNRARDMNQDGLLNHDDVDLVAREAVRL